MLLHILQAPPQPLLTAALTHFRSSSCPQSARGYLGLDDGLGAGLQHGEVVGEHQELQLLCLQHHLNVVLHSSRLATHTHTKIDTDERELLNPSLHQSTTHRGSGEISEEVN